MQILYHYFPSFDRQEMKIQLMLQILQIDNTRMVNQPGKERIELLRLFLLN